MRRPLITLVSVAALALLGLTGAAPATATGTTLTVNTATDTDPSSGPCHTGSTTVISPLSLRDAVCLANNIGGTVDIVVPANTYHLGFGELDLGVVGSNVTISGAGSGSTIVDAGGTSRVFNIDSSSVGNVTTTLQGLTVTGGADSVFGGAGILAGSAGSSPADALTLTGVTVSGNNAGGAAPAATNLPGGGLQFLGGQLTISNSTFSGNSTRSSPGAAIAYQAAGVGTEGFSMTGTTVSGNSAINQASATDVVDGAVELGSPSNSVPMSISSSRFASNVVTGTNGPGRGGAVALEAGTLSITGSTFTGNTVSGVSSRGGAIAVVDGAATVQDNRIVGNTAPLGGGLALVGAGTVTGTDNWWGCNAGPGLPGCDTVTGAPTVNPWLVLSASAVTTTAPATAPVTADVKHDSNGTSVGAAQPALDGVSMSFADPQPSGATCLPGSVALSGGTAAGTCTYTPNGAEGAGHVLVTVDNQTITVPVTVNRAPSVTTNPTDQTVLGGTTATFSAAADGFPAPTVQWQVSTDGGTTFTNISGATSSPLTFTAAAAQSGNKYRAVFTNSVGSATSSAATLTVQQPPAFTSGSTANFTAGTNGSFHITTSGLPPVASITDVGVLPAGLTFTDNGNGTADIAGTPAPGTGGTYSVSLTASNGVSPDATQTLTVVVAEAPAVTANPSDVTAAPGTTVTFTAAASGYPAPTVQWQSSTDGGATFTNIPGANGTSYAFLASAPLDGTQYRAVFTNTQGSATSTAATLSVRQAPTFTSGNAATFTVGTPGSFLISTSGIPNPAITETGGLPSGVTLHDNGDGTAVLSGTPDVGTGGVGTITLKADNGVAPAGTQSFTLTVDEAPHISSANTATFPSGVASSFLVTTDRGYPVPALAVSAGLPAGLAFTDNGNGTATISGTTTALGAQTVTVTASNSAGTDPQTLTIFVTQPAAITSAPAATFTTGTAGTFTVTTSGYPAPAITETGALPSGVTLTDNGDGTATLAGTPAAGTGGTYPLTITAHNGVGADATQSFTLTVDQAPSVTSGTPTGFVVGTAGTYTLTTSGFPTPSLSANPGLPPGLSFVDNGDGTGTLSGTPTAGGTYTVTFTATNTAGSATQSFTFVITQAAGITSASSTTFVAGALGTFTVTTSGIPSPSIGESGALPSGVTFTDNGDGTATLAGTPAAGTGGTYPLTITAHNGVGADATQNFTLTVDQAAAITSAGTVTFGAAVAATPFTVTSSGFPKPALAETGALPSGVTFVDNGDGTATLAGTPAAGTAGNYPLTITAHNGVGSDGTQSFTLVVSVAPQAITFTSTPPVSPVVGQTYGVSATGGGSGNPVTFTIDAAATGFCSISGSTVTFTHPGSCVIDAHQAGNGQYAPADSSQSVAVTKAATTTTVAVTAHAVTATVTAVAPGAGTPTGSVTFAVNGTPVGTATLSGGVATLAYTVPTGHTQNVAAVYAGDGDFTGSSGSTARQDPSITATVTSSVPRTSYGWYRVPVTITFHCATHGAPLTAVCPAPVTLTHDGAGQAVTRTVMATDGGAATVTVHGINIDRTAPTVSVAGVTNGAYYPGAAPRARCVAHDALSGVASCTLSSRTSGASVTVTARASDKAGNVRTAQVTYHVLRIYVLGAPFSNGAYTLAEGRTYTVVVLTSGTAAPRYYDAVPLGQTPRPADNFFLPGGSQYGLHRFALAVRVDRGLGRYFFWVFGVKIGSTMNLVKFHPTH